MAMSQQQCRALRVINISETMASHKSFPDSAMAIDLDVIHSGFPNGVPSI